MRVHAAVLVCVCVLVCAGWLWPDDWNSGIYIYNNRSFVYMVCVPLYIWYLVHSFVYMVLDSHVWI